jgi:AbrB family looped-hinge helix DNA binding protein
MEALVKISSKGQVTIPKKFREFLGTNLIRFRIIEGRVIIEPVKDVGGIFKKYVKKSLPFKEERESAWQKVADEYRDLSRY